MPKSIPELYLELLESHRDGNSINPMPALVQQNSGMKMFALLVPPTEAWTIMLNEIGDLATSEVIFGIDRYTRADQGVLTKSVVTVYHWKREQEGLAGWRFAVVPYDENGCLPVQWDHPYWTPIQRTEVEYTVVRQRELLSQKIAALGLPEEAAEKLMDRLNEVTSVLTEPELHALVNEVLTEYRSIH